MANVVQEIRELKTLGARFLRICDANFVLSAERTMEFCQRVAPLGMSWTCWQRGDVGEPEVYRAMKRAGCQQTTFGVESLDEHIRNAGHEKGLSDESLLRAVRSASEAGLDVTIEIILGYPGEGVPEVLAGIRRAREVLRHVDYVNISLLKVVPQTSLWQRMTDSLPAQSVKRLWLRSMFQMVPVWRFTPEFTERWLDETAGLYLRQVYHRPGYLLRQVARSAMHRKRLIWRNRGEILRQTIAKVGRKIRGERVHVP